MVRSLWIQSKWRYLARQGLGGLEPTAVTCGKGWYWRLDVMRSMRLDHRAIGSQLRFSWIGVKHLDLWIYFSTHCLLFSIILTD